MSNYRDLSSAEWKLRGLALLSSFVARAGLEQDVLASYPRQLHLKELEQSLRSSMEEIEEGYKNAKFNGLAESVARCFLLYEETPDLYARLVRGLCSSDSEMFLDTFQGLLLLNTLQRGLADDHDYSFNARKGTIERSSEEPAGKGLCPALLLDILASRQPSVYTEKKTERGGVAQAQVDNWWGVNEAIDCEQECEPEHLNRPVQRG